MKKWNSAFFTILVVVFVSTQFLHCGDDENKITDQKNEGEDTEIVSNVCSNNYEIKQAAFIDSKSKWNTEAINVCWLNADDYSKEDLEFIKNTIKSTWDKEIDLDFVYWQKCFTGLEEIKILISDERPKSVVGSNYYYRIGFENMQWTMVLNFTYNKWSTSCNKNESSRRFCMRRNAMHEFGHAIGLAHEQYRKDTPQWCLDMLKGDGLPEDNVYYGDTYYGEWDKDSIMNYCSSAFELSCKDIASGVFLYGEENDQN